MAGRTISSSISGTVQLAETDNPLTILGTGTVTSTDAPALATAGTVDWVIGNAGTITAGGTANASVGIQLNTGLGSAGGTITNEATGRISGGRYGIYSLQTTTVTNAGTIAGTNANNGVGISIGPGTVTNSGAAALISGGRTGVWLDGAGQVVNSGSIGATTNYGVLLSAGGGLDNQAGGRVTGGVVGVFATGTIASAIGNDGSIAGRFGVLVTNAATTVTNSGSIHATGKFTPGAQAELVGSGVQVRAGGTIVNEAGGQISGYWIGAQVGSFSGANPNGGAVINAGTILANDPTVSGAAVWFKGNGRIENASTGLIGNGPYGIVTYDTVTVANAGVIAGNKGVLFKGQGRIENAAGGTIGGGAYGILTYDTTTIVNHGSIGGSDFAVFTNQAGKASRIVTYPGASFGGTVLGDKQGVATPTGILELGAGVGAGAITGFGSRYLGFGRVEVDAGATWSLAGTVAVGQTIALGGAGAALTLQNPAGMAGVITGFTANTQLVLGGLSDVTGVSLGPSNLVTVTRSGGANVTLLFDPGQVFPPGSFGFSAGGGGTVLTAPCFALGTRIATPEGEVAVEALEAGQRVRLARGGLAEVTWVGHRRVDCRRHPRPQEVWPVRILAGAFARGVPARDLLLSPDHAVFANGVLIPVRHLVNGCTVRQEAVESITYFHVELAAHDVLLADALPCESYLDTGNRAAFANGGGAMMLHADFARRTWSEAACAPLVEEGAEVTALRDRLLARAGALGHRRSPDPALTLLADGVPLLSGGAGRWRDVALPDGARAVALASRSWVPAEMAAGSDDTRRLGVAIGRVMLDGQAVAPGDACFGAGWHAPEGDWRWSDGMGWLHARGARRLSFEVASAGLYWLGARAASG